MEVPTKMEDIYIFGQCMNMYCDEFPCTYYVASVRNSKRCMHCCCMDYQHELLWQKRGDRWFSTASKREPPLHYTQPRVGTTYPPAGPTDVESATKSSHILRRFATPKQNGSSAADKVNTSSTTVKGESSSEEDETFMGVSLNTKKRPFAK